MIGNTHCEAQAEAERALIKSLLLQCDHCLAWSPSPVVFWLFSGFQRARDRGLSNRCPACSRSNGAGEQKYRVFFDDGLFLEG